MLLLDLLAWVLGIVAVLRAARQEARENAEWNAWLESLPQDTPLEFDWEEDSCRVCGNPSGACEVPGACI